MSNLKEYVLYLLNCAREAPSDNKYFFRVLLTFFVNDQGEKFATTDTWNIERMGVKLMS